MAVGRIDRALRLARSIAQRAAQEYGSSPFPASVRREIFEALSFTPERRELVEKVLPVLEEQGFAPTTKKAWLHGSFVTPEKAPKDIDVVLDEGYTWESKVANNALHMMMVPDETGTVARMLRRAGGDKYGEDYDWIRIAGTAAAAAAGLGAAPDEAEAAGPTKGITKAIGKLIESSSAARLKGTQLMVGDELRTIENVFKGEGNKRIIRFTDGLEITKDKSELHHLAREIGTRVYTGMLENKNEAEQLAQAIRSLKYHQARGNPFFTKQHKSDLMKEHRVIIQNLGGGEPVEHVWVIAGPGMKNRFYMPKVYADILEKYGLITIPGKKLNVEE